MADRIYLVYQVTNRFDGKIYVGVHSTLNKNDRYMGSGVEIKEVLKKYGRKSFVKEILFEFDTKEEMLTKEKEIVTKEFCMREDTYNRIEGGGTYGSEGMTTVKDHLGNTSKVYCDDPRYLSGELVGYMNGTKNNKVSIALKKTIAVRDKDGICFRVDLDDPKYLSGELVPQSKGINIINGWDGKRHSQDTKQKMSTKASQRTGEKNSSFGTCWITNEGENKKIKKEDLDVYIQQGWIKGRK